MKRLTRMKGPNNIGQRQPGDSETARSCTCLRARRNNALNVSRQSRSTDGFTLLELLVVTAIIMILSSLLLTAIANAKEKASSIKCISRHKQWALGFQQYSFDNDNFIAREGILDNGLVRLHTWADIRGNENPTNSGTRTSDDVWFNALADYVGVNPASYYSHPARRPGFYENQSLFHCPSARIPGDAQNSSWLFVYFSIAMNSQLITPYHHPTVHTTNLESDGNNTVIFLDNLLPDEEKVDPFQDDFDLGQPASWATRFAGRRHGNGGVLSFIDGRAGRFEGEKVVDTEENSSTRGRAPLTGPDFVWEPGLLRR